MRNNHLSPILGHFVENVAPDGVEKQQVENVKIDAAFT